MELFLVLHPIYWRLKKMSKDELDKAEMEFNQIYDIISDEKLTDEHKALDLQRMLPMKDKKPEEKKI